MAADQVIIAIGSNLGDARENVLRATKKLQLLSETPVIRSSLWRTVPVDCPPGSPDFVNAVVSFRPRAGESPETLMVKLKAMELEFGRKSKTVVNEPRPLDLDLIAFGNEVRTSEDLVLPHPRATERRFVLTPLNEIASDLILPGQKQTVAELLRALPPAPSMRRLHEL